MAAVRALLREASAVLTDAGVASPEHDAAALLAHVLDVPRSRLPLVDDVGEQDAGRLAALVARRASREPLQHLVGTAAFRHLELAVGPGVFVPRPETELLAGWAVEAALALQAAGTAEPVVVDLCTGSGAIAGSVAHEVPGARVHAVELSEDAFDWASRNLAGSGVDLRQGDLADAFEDLLGHVDVVVSNPPYVPLEAWESVAPEARDHDPHLALFSGDDGLDAIRVIARRAQRLLRPGGVLGFEHADAQGESAPEVLVQVGGWEDVRDHADLAGRARYCTARLAR
ncbi:peptide chain release factor N(5)-glutamine methyltransferase [Nocardioides bruguierae]|uniref:peptide chain release factor N(5)-glutamine methyltransferase n=1 Tax=Nocardioides bruguierae TaxID=2945102 RepID=UPI0020204424|nr:peptide chain release factor N(5)-glutamine methyltransferase [Nocardioides bruguierae]MCL8024787.1 peptide chain release factor N(5)-glutamine methyltransferase [Nocardioides bruguierae]